MALDINKIFALLHSGAVSFTDFMTTLLDNVERKTEFDADFMDKWDVSNVLHKGNTGFCLDGKRSLNNHNSYSHSLIIGGSGVGKSATILIPSIQSIAKGGSSMVIHDPSTELLRKMIRYLIELGYEVKILNYTNPSESEGYNPQLRESNAAKLAQTLVESSNRGSKGDPFWQIAAKTLIALVITFFNKYVPPKYRTLKNCLYTISALSHSATGKLAELFIKTGDEELINEYKSLLSYGDKTLGSIIATSKAALSFLDDDVSLVTSHDTIDFAEFRKKKIALFINNSVADQRYYSVISSLFFEQFWAYLMGSLPRPSDKDIFFLVDESSSLFLPGLPVAINNLRKARAGNMLVFQSFSQVVDMYGSFQAKNIAANCFSKVYLPGQPLETATELEAILGKFEYQDEKQVRHTRSLMNASEIRMMDSSIILCSNLPPIKAKLTPYFEQYRFKRIVADSDVSIPNKLPFSKPPIYLIDEAKEK